MKSKTVKLTEDYVVQDEKIVEAEVTSVSFVQFANMVDAANEAVEAKQANKINTAIQRERLFRQVSLKSASGKSVKLRHEDLTLLPRTVAKQLLDAIDDVAGTDDAQGEILTEGNGMTTPILYKLGTPIKGADGKSISELEFLAKTYGPVEDIYAASEKTEQVILLITQVAKPVGMQALPSWAIDQITISDGLTITQKVLPSFLR